MTTTLVIRNSELSTWRRCRFKWHLAYRRHWQPKMNAVPLRFGDLVHRALAAYYIPGVKRGPAPALTFSKLYSEQLEQYGDFGMYTEEDEWTNALDLGMEMLKGYVKEYGKDERYKIVSPEHPFQVIITDDDGNDLATFVGTMDAIAIDLETNLTWLLEHKTAKSIRTDHLILDDQAGTYYALAPLVLEELGLPPLDGILYNFLRKGMPDERERNELGQYLNKDGTVSKRQPSPLFMRHVVRRGAYDGQQVLNRIAEQAIEITYADEEQLAIYKNPNYDCGMCQFKDICELHEAGADYEDLAEATMKPWNPYEIHDGYLLSESGK